MPFTKLTEVEEEVFRTGICPDCGGPLLTGPSGGMSTNYLCGGLGESRYNDMLGFGVDRISTNHCPKVRPLSKVERGLGGDAIAERNGRLIELKNYVRAQKKPSLWKRYWTIGDPLAYQVALIITILSLLATAWRCSQ